MMVYTAVMVPMTDFLTGVLSALIIYFVCKRVFLRSSGETQA
jgi:SulP family sulfate permease